MEDQMHEAQELINQFQRDFPSIQDAVRWFLANAPNLPPESVEALLRLEKTAWSHHDMDLFNQTIANSDMPTIRRLMEDRTQRSEGN